MNNYRLPYCGLALNNGSRIFEKRQIYILADSSGLHLGMFFKYVFHDYPRKIRLIQIANVSYEMQLSDVTDTQSITRTPRRLCNIDSLNILHN